jgi:hypothetical protein
VSRKSFPDTTAALTALFQTNFFTELSDAFSAAVMLKLFDKSLPDFLPPSFRWGRSHQTEPFLTMIN